MEGLVPGLLAFCFVVGMLGAMFGAWICTLNARARLEAQRDAFELAREKAERDLQQALLCVPQWIQRTVRVELELMGRQQTQRWNELVREQDELRRTEWQALLAGSVARRRAEKAPVAPMTAAKTMSPSSPARAPEPRQTQQPALEPVAMQAAPERELTDAEIDALPPDLPAPARSPGRKLPAPRTPVLRNI